MITRPRIALVIGVASLAALSGCASGTGRAAGTAATKAAAKATATPSPTPTESVAQLTKTLETSALKRADLPSDMRLALVPGGSSLTQTTLNDCGYDYTTEKDRVARREYDVTEHGQDTGLQNELVAYDSAADAAKALAQFRTATEHCPTGTIHDKVDGAYTEGVLRKAAPESDLPLAHNEVAEFVVTPKGQEATYGVIILQQQGRFLDNIYVEDDLRPDKDDWSAARHFATITGGRLAGVAPATV